MSPVKYELDFYIPEEVILHKNLCVNSIKQNCGAKFIFVSFGAYCFYFEKYETGLYNISFH
jgi:hypothetical protein